MDSDDGLPSFSPAVFTDFREWTYNMRREMQEIIPGLYLGPYSAACKTQLDYLLEHHITHIVCIRHEMEGHFVRPNFPSTFRYLILEIADSPSENIIQHFTPVREFLDECFERGGKGLVHGNAGISRSAALVIGYIMEKFGLAYRDTFLKVQQRRFCINVNERFAQQLKEYEPIYRAKYLMSNRENCLTAGNLKRSFEESENESQQPSSMDLST